MDGGDSELSVQVIGLMLIHIVQPFFQCVNMLWLFFVFPVLVGRFMNVLEVSLCRIYFCNIILTKIRSRRDTFHFCVDMKLFLFFSGRVLLGVHRSLA
jgi:hypothetical protein